jgi:hypothetical protein
MVVLRVLLGGDGGAARVRSLRFTGVNATLRAPSYERRCKSERRKGNVLRPFLFFGALLALVAAAPAVASVMSGGGTGTVALRSVEVVRDADGNVVQERTLEGTVSGALTGTFVEHVRGVVKKSGDVTFVGTMIFEGTVAGCGAGTLVLRVVGKAVSGLPTSEGRLTTIAGGTLAVRGTATFGQVGPALTYEAKYVC